MSDSLITIVAIFLAAILMFVFPLASISEMNDSETLALVQAYTTEFVNRIKSRGKITQEDYDEYIQKLYATGNSYDVEFEVHRADINPGKKTENQQMGDSVYYIEYTKQVEDALRAFGAYTLKEGDFIKVSFTNTNTTVSQMIKSVLYSVTGDSSYISGSAAGTCGVTGSY